MFTLARMWLSHDFLKEKIRNGISDFFENNHEPRMLLIVQETNMRRIAKGIPSIFA